MKGTLALVLLALAASPLLCEPGSGHGETPMARRQPGEQSSTGDLRAAVGSAAESLMRGGQTVGLSIGVLEHGRTHTFHFGTIERGAHRPPTAHTLYGIGSITKTFTGALLARASIEKRVSLDDDVRRYLDGDFPNLMYQGQPIRLWQLINHTSGLPRLSPREKLLFDSAQDSDFAQTAVKEAEFVESYTEEEFLQDLHGVMLTRAPGVSFSYSNVGAQLLGRVLEKVYSRSYEELLYTKITGPLQMEETKVLLSRKETARLPRGYSAGRPFVWPVSSRFPAAGSLKSSASDMLKYIAWNIAEKDEAVKLAHRTAGNTVWSADNSYTVGLNWQILRKDGLRQIFQDGSLPGFHSLCAMCPELGLGIVVLTNEEVRSRPTNLSPLVNQVFRSIDPRAAELP